MQTALHIYSLKRELQDNLGEALFVGSEFYKKEREAYLVYKGKKGSCTLGLAYHPVGYGIFFIPRGKINVRTKEKPWPFFQSAYGSRLTAIEQIDFDRILRIEMANGGEKYAIIAEAIGPNGNFWLLDDEDKIIATLRNKKFDAGKPYSPPSIIDKLSPPEVTASTLRNQFAESESPLAVFLKKNIAGIDEILSEEIVVRADMDGDRPVNVLNEADIEAVAAAIGQVVDLFGRYYQGYLYEKPAAVAPMKLKSLESEPEKFKSLSLAVYEIIRSRKIVRARISEEQKVLDGAEKYIKRLKRRLRKIEGDIESASMADLYRRQAEALKANLGSIEKGKTEITLDDLYDASEQLKIRLDPALTAAENADEYFKKWRKARESLGLLTRRKEITEAELAEKEKMMAALREDFETASEKYGSEISQILPREAARRSEVPRLPYREFTLSSGVKIFVGKDGADNDETTFHHARPYELWFHAAQSPGSHVVMKFPDRNFEPSKLEIAETAAAAAYYSRQKSSKTVPVTYTERKYVRKPRGAKPGLVTVDRTKTIMVEPKKPEG
jgi:predicted ribosome quality control (RQC) complex YloA/Tae2 family protein